MTTFASADTHLTEKNGTKLTFSVQECIREQTAFRSKNRNEIKLKMVHALEKLKNTVAFAKI